MKSYHERNKMLFIFYKNSSLHFIQEIIYIGLFLYRFTFWNMKFLLIAISFFHSNASVFCSCLYGRYFRNTEVGVEKEYENSFISVSLFSWYSKYFMDGDSATDIRIFIKLHYFSFWLLPKVENNKTFFVKNKCSCHSLYLSNPSLFLLSANCQDNTYNEENYVRKTE